MHTRRQFLATTASIATVGGVPSPCISQETDPDAVSLVSLPIASLAGAIKSTTKPFSVSGIAVDSGFHMFNNGSGSVVVNLRGRFRSFEAVVGMVDGIDPFSGNQTEYKVELDGRTISAGAVQKNGKPVFLKLNVTDGHSLHIVLTSAGGIGNALLGTKEITVEEGALVPNDRPVLLAPANRARNVADAVTFKWKPFLNARSYAVQVILKKRLGKRQNPDQHLWAFTVAGEMTESLWDLKDAPSGEYAWSVLAFDAEDQIGTFSDERTFSVVR